jgi:hypothetical protein
LHIRTDGEARAHCNAVVPCDQIADEHTHTSQRADDSPAPGHNRRTRME